MQTIHFDPSRKNLKKHLSLSSSQFPPRDSHVHRCRYYYMYSACVYRYIVRVFDWTEFMCRLGDNTVESRSRVY